MKAFITSGTSWSGVRTDGSPITVECIGGGGGGGAGGNSAAGVGGGGGSYAKLTVAYTSLTAVTGIQIGQGGAAGIDDGSGNPTGGSDGTDTRWDSGVVVAKGGKSGGNGGAGGAAASCTPSAGAFSGGQGVSGGGGAAGKDGAGKAGGTGGANTQGGGGGGGADGGSSTAGVAQLGGTGGQGGTATDGTAGGAPGATTGTGPAGSGSHGSGGGGGSVGSRSGGTGGGQGGDGVEWDSTHGAGGGGGGAPAIMGATGGPGGLYGGGGGAGGFESHPSISPGATGANGLIVITYTPAADGVYLWINEPSLGLTDRTSFLAAAGSTGYTLTEGQRGTGTIQMRIPANSSYVPTVGVPIYFKQIASGVEIIRFAGTIDSIPVKFVGDQGDRFYTLAVVSLMQAFDTIQVGPRFYSGKTDGYIVNDLLVNVCGGVPVTAGTISAGANAPDVAYTDADFVGAVFNARATSSGFSISVDNATSQLNFVAPTTIAAPQNIGDGDIIWQQIDWKETRQDYRNRQVVQMAMSGSVVSEEQIPTGSSPTTTYTAAKGIDTLLSADIITGGAPGVQPLAFSAQPAIGDTVTINCGALTAGDQPYIYVAALDNTVPWQVLKGASTAASVSNLADAINGNPATAGTAYSLPTRENRAVHANYMGGASLAIQLKAWSPQGKTWSSLTNYVVGDIVLFSSVYYVAQAPSLNVTPGTDATKWQVAVASLAVSVTGTSISSVFLRSITIDHTKCGTLNSSFFPVLVAITDATFKTVANGGNVAQTAGWDILFWSDSIATSPLLWEIDYYDGVAGTLLAWVRVPTLSHTADTVIYVTYGNPGIASFQGIGFSATGAAGVYHFRGAAAATYGQAYLNAIGVNPNLTFSGITSTDSGFIDGAAIFNGSSDHATGVKGNTSPFTVSCWVKPTSASGQHVVYTSDSDFVSGIGLWLYSDGADWKFSSYDPTINNLATAFSTGTVATGVWQHVVGIYDGGNSLTRIYVNKVQGTDDNTNTLTTPSGGVLVNMVGKGAVGQAGSTVFFAGQIDELRVFNVAVDASWVTSEYNTAFSPSTFFILGAQTTIAIAFTPGAEPSIRTPLVIGTDVFVTKGSATLTMANAPLPFLHLDVTYYAAGADMVRVEDTPQVAVRAGVEHGSGKYQAFLAQTNVTDWATALGNAVALLAKYDILPEIAQIGTFLNGYQPGQKVTITITSPAAAAVLLNGDWTVQSVQATYRQALAGPKTPGARACFSYQLTLTSGIVATWISGWEALTKQ